MPTNMAHPAIEALILEFLYQKHGSMAEVYPEDFAQEVPNHAVALVTTCVRLFSTTLVLPDA